MFACIYCSSVSETTLPSTKGNVSLVDLAFTFSPLVEQTTADTVVLDISGQDLLFGSPKDPVCALDSVRNEIAASNCKLCEVWDRVSAKLQKVRGWKSTILVI